MSNFYTFIGRITFLIFRLDFLIRFLIFMQLQDELYV